MKRLFTKFEIVILLLAILVIGSIVFSGCGKCRFCGKKTETTMEMAGEQKVCPMTGMAVNKDIYTEYKGKKVYFCSQACKAEFLKDPEKYVSKLPQFKE